MLRFDQPVYLWLLLLAIPVVYLGLRSLGTLEGARRWTALGVRLLVLVLLVLMLAGVQAVRWHEDLTVVAVLDRSESVTRFASGPKPGATVPGGASGASGASGGQTQQTIQAWSDDLLARAAKQKKNDDRIGVVSFDGKPTVRAMPHVAFDAATEALGEPVEGSDTASALRLAMALFPPDSGKRLVLMSDGNDTDSGGQLKGELLAAAREAKAAGIPVDVLPVEYRLENEVQLEAVHAPTEARQGQTAALRVVLRATGPSEGLLFLKRDDEVVDLSPTTPSDAASIAVEDWSRDDSVEAAQDAQAQTARYVCVRLLQLPLGQSGPSRFEAVFESKGADTVTANNRAEAFTLVQGKGRVLILDNLGSGPGDILPQALREHGIDLEVMPAAGAPSTLTAMQRYDAVFLQNVPAELIPPPQQRMLAQYVSEVGGGLVMVGGPDSFAAGGWTGSPIDRILPVECQIPSQTILPSGALVLVIDRSGSMASGVTGSQYSKLEIAAEAAVQAISTLYPQDLVGVVVFDDSAQWVVSLTPVTNPKSIAGQVRSVQPGGGTNMYPGMVEAYQTLAPLKAQDAAVKHVIVLTDGQSQDAQWFKIVGDMKKAGITLSTVGVGDDVNGQLLSQIATMAGGNYYPVTNPNNLPKIFVKEARTIRKNLIKEKPFTPRHVQTGSPIITGLAQSPTLTGLVLTGHKNDPRVFTPMLGPEGEPLFAHWQVGLGRTAAFTSDATNRWAAAWLSWPGYGDFWARLTRAVARPSASRAFDLASTIRNDRLHLRLDAPGQENKGFQNFMQVVGTVLKPDGSPHRVTLSQTGPGVYEADLPADQVGNYIVNLFAANPSDPTQAQTIIGGTTRPPGAELRRFTSNRPLLEQIAALTGGRVLDPTAEEPPPLFSRQSLTASRSIRPLWRTLLAWLLALLLIDVAVRRIAWDFAGMRDVLADEARAWVEWFKPRPVEAGATLAALKEKRAAVVREHHSPAAPPPPSSRKFEAAPDAKASEDFASAVGAATEAPRFEAPTAAPPAADQADATSRLLDAKRRAQERLRGA